MESDDIDPALVGNQIESGDPEEHLPENGRFVMSDPEVAVAQREYAISYLKSLGKSLFGGQIMNRAMPAAPGVFCGESELLTVASHLCLVNVDVSDPIAALLNISLNALFQSVQSQLKPFNPMIGETLLVHHKGVKVAAEQIANHPPTCLVRIKGAGYELNAAIALGASLGLNGVTVHRGGLTLLTINGKTHAFAIPDFRVHGLLNGRRWGCFVGSLRYWLDCGREIPVRRLVGGRLERPPDFCVAIGGPNRLDSVSGTLNQTAISGLWTSRIFYGEMVVFDSAAEEGFAPVSQGTLPSDQGRRGDIIAFRRGDYAESNRIKAEYEALQRIDRKTRVNDH